MTEIKNENGEVIITSTHPVEIRIRELVPEIPDEGTVIDPPIITDPPETPGNDTPTNDPTGNDTPGNDPVPIPVTEGRVLTFVDFAKYAPGTVYTRNQAKKDFPGHGGGASLDDKRHIVVTQDGETGLKMNMKAGKIGTKDSFFLPNIPLDDPKKGYPRLIAETRLFIPSDFQPVKGGKLITSLTAGKEGAFDRPDGKVRGGNFTLMWKQEGRMQHYIRHINQRRDEFADDFESDVKLPFGRWFDLKHDCFIGDPGQSNGYMKTYLDGVLVFETIGLDMVRPGADFVGLWNMNVQFFFGGNTGDWQTPSSPKTGQSVIVKYYRVSVPGSEVPTDPGSGGDTGGGGDTPTDPGTGGNGGGDTGGGPVILPGTGEVKEITLADLTGGSLEPGKYKLKAGNSNSNYSPSDRFLPGVQVDMSQFQMGGVLAVEYSRKLMLSGVQSRNSSGSGIVVDGDVQDLFLPDVNIYMAKDHGIKISGGTEQIHPKRIYASGLIDGAGIGSASGDGGNIHGKTSLQVAFVKDVYFHKLTIKNVQGEGEFIGNSAWNGDGFYMLDCWIQGHAKIGGHGTKNIHVHNCKFDADIHIKYVENLILSGLVEAQSFEIAVQKNHRAGEISKGIVLDAALSGKFPIKNGQKAPISYEANLLAPVMLTW